MANLGMFRTSGDFVVIHHIPLMLSKLKEKPVFYMKFEHYARVTHIIKITLVVCNAGV